MGSLPLSLGELILKIKPFLIISTSFDKVQGEGEKKSPTFLKKTPTFFRKSPTFLGKKTPPFFSS